MSHLGFVLFIEHHANFIILYPCKQYNQGFLIYLYFRIRYSLAHLRPVILSADWSISRFQSWTCLSLPTVAEFVKLTQSIVIEIQRQSADLYYKVQLCNRPFFVVSTAIYVVKVYECHPLGIMNLIAVILTQNWVFVKLKMKRTSQFAWKKNTYCQILKEKRKEKKRKHHHATTLDFTNLLVKLCNLYSWKI